MLTKVGGAAGESVEMRRDGAAAMTAQHVEAHLICCDNEQVRAGHRETLRLCACRDKVGRGDPV
jgi:hypothetical protein